MLCLYLLMRATGGIRLTASGPVLVQQPAAAGRVRALWQRRAYACGCARCLRKVTPSSLYVFGPMQGSTEPRGARL